MADLTQELVDQIQRIADALESSSEHTADMSEALRALQSTTRSITDLSKQLSDSVGVTSEAFRVVLDTVNKISSSMKEAVVLSEEQKRSVAEMVVMREREALLHQQNLTLLSQIKLEAEIYKQTEEARAAEAAKALEAEQTRLANQSKLVEGLNEAFSITKKIAEAEEATTLSLAKRGYEIDKMTGKRVKAKGLDAAIARARLGFSTNAMNVATGSATLAPVVGAIGSGIAGLAGLAGSAAGVGGIIGMLINAVTKREEIEAAGQRVSQAFDVAGAGGARFTGRLTAITRALDVAKAASSEAMGSVARSFVEFNLTADETMKKMAGMKTGFGSELAVATLAVDKALEMAEGNMARLAGTISQNFNVGVEEAFRRLGALGAAAKDAGLNAASFMQQVVALSGTLSMLNVDLDSVGDSQLRLTKAMQAEGFGKGFSANFSARGMSSIAGAIAGMSEGLRAVVGERLGMSDPMEAVYRLGGGTLMGNNQLEFDKIVAEMGRMARENGQTLFEQSMFLQKVMGVDQAGADAILRFQGAGEGDRDALRKLIEGGFKSESQKTSDITRAVEQIRDGFLNVALGLLSALVNLGKMSYGGLMSLYNLLQYFKSSFIDKDDTKADYYMAQVEDYSRAATESGKAIIDSMPQIVKGAKQVYGGAKNIVEQFVGTGASEKADELFNRASSRPIPKSKGGPEPSALAEAAKLGFMLTPAGGVYQLGKTLIRMSENDKAQSLSE